MRLTTPFKPIPTGAARLGEYMGLATSGCVVYASYPKVEPDQLRCNVYVTRVSLCPADVTADGLIAADDVGAFSIEFSQLSARADMNSDGTHNGADVERFLNTYTCGCVP